MNHAFTVIKNNWVGILFTLFVLRWGVHLHALGHSIKGPFIFGDESTYFAFARSFFRGDTIKHFTQYGPLYPYLISKFFYFSDVITTYKAIRVFNVLLYVSTTIPAYLLGSLLFQGSAYRWLLPFCVLLSPFSGLIYLVWAEPLYIVCLYWAIYVFALFIKHPCNVKSILLALCLAALYYTKPASGLATQIAAILILSCNAISTRSLRWNVLTAVLCVLIDLPWMLHYHHLGLSIIGYKGATDEFNKLLAATSWLYIGKQFFFSLFYQYTYCWISTWGLCSLSVVLIYTRRNKLEKYQIMTLAFILLSLSGLIALCALGVSTHPQLDYRLPNGRYYSAILPLLSVYTLFILFKTQNDNRLETRILIAAIAVSFILCLLASPFYVFNPLDFDSLPELSPFIYLHDNGLVIWRALITHPTFVFNAGFALFFGLFSLSLVLYTKSVRFRHSAILIILLGTCFSAYSELHYITAIGPLNYQKVFFYFLQNHIDKSKIGFDEKFAEDNTPALTSFWLDTSTRYMSRSKAAEEAQKNHGLFFVSRSKLPLKQILVADPYIVYYLEKN